MSEPEARGPEEYERAWSPAVRQELADGDRLGRRAILQQRLQLYGKVERFESLLGGRDLVGPPPAMAERPAALALVEARGVDLGAIGAAEEKALAVQHVLAAPTHADASGLDAGH